jgi:hypothetical protein
MAVQSTRAAGPALADIPAFDGYPYLVTRVVKGLYHVALLPSRESYEALRDVTRRQVAANRLQSCLVLDAGTALYVHLDGTEQRSANLPRAAAVATRRLRLCREMPEWAELDVRRVRLDAFIERHTPGGHLLGDLSKGGRPATGDERVALEGKQDGGVPRGLDRCPVCGRWRGYCLDPNPTWRGLVMKVECPCDNDTVCARCARPLAEWRLNSNYYEPKDGHIWHVPAFCAFSHRCPDASRRSGLL